MSKSLEALKRLDQETCPATYMQDFDKKECIEIIRKDLEVLEILKSEDDLRSVLIGVVEALWEARKRQEKHEERFYCEKAMMSKEKLMKIKEWLER